MVAAVSDFILLCFFPLILLSSNVTYFPFVLWNCSKLTTVGLGTGDVWE